jgi:uncharacterized protein YeaC (DUF1315 family)
VAKKRKITNDVLQRVLRADIELGRWMTTERIPETDTESCMRTLVERNVYNYDWNNRGHYFREDLRTLRDNNQLNVFNNLIIEQKAPGSKWLVKLKNGH